MTVDAIVVTGDELKQRAKELMQAADRGDAIAVASMISDDFRLELMLRSPLTLPTGEPFQAVYDREAYLGFVQSIPSFTKDGMHVRYDLAVAEGPNVVLFGESDATAPSGSKYANAYSWLFRFADDKIAILREYCDFNAVRTALFS
jgi:ketosteroid isomerase-like protein